jgi:hypothetical protein
MNPKGRYPAEPVWARARPGPPSAPASASAPVPVPASVTHTYTAPRYSEPQNYSALR